MIVRIVVDHWFFACDVKAPSTVACHDSFISIHLLFHYNGNELFFIDYGELTSRAKIWIAEATGCDQWPNYQQLFGWVKLPKNKREKILYGKNTGYIQKLR